MERKQFTFYRSYLDAIIRLPKKEQGAILLAICQYALNESEPTGLSPIAETVFTLVRPTLDAGRRKANAGEAGGKTEAKQKQTASKTEAKQKQTASKTEAKQKQTAREKEGEVEIEVEIEKENECYREKTPNGVEKKQRFVPPTVEQVAEYCLKRGNKVDPQRWHDHYSAKGWVVGKSPMKDWKAAVRTWEQRDAERLSAKAVAKERDYSEGWD